MGKKRDGGKKRSKDREIKESEGGGRGEKRGRAREKAKGVMERM